MRDIPDTEVTIIADREAGKEHDAAFHYVDKGNMATNGRFHGIVSIGKQPLSEPLTGKLSLYLNGKLLSEGPVEALGDIGERLSWLAE
ncbi:MAG TPA: hypothetical protein VFU49_23180 [Ktedonobacteraceae bacterium]|nr:hypothetical protein [Ktedonobacteraceae bacterium]